MLGNLPGNQNFHCQRFTGNSLYELLLQNAQQKNDDVLTQSTTTVEPMKTESSPEVFLEPTTVIQSEPVVSVEKPSPSLGPLIIEPLFVDTEDQKDDVHHFALEDDNLLMKEKIETCGNVENAEGKNFVTRDWNKFETSYRQYFITMPEESLKWGGLEVTILHQRETDLSHVEFVHATDLVQKKWFLPTEVLEDSQGNALVFIDEDECSIVKKSESNNNDSNINDVHAHDLYHDDDDESANPPEDNQYALELRALQKQVEELTQTIESRDETIKLHQIEIHQQKQQIMELQQENEELKANQQELEEQKIEEITTLKTLQLENIKRCQREHEEKLADYVKRDLRSLKDILDLAEFSDIFDIESLCQRRIQDLRYQEYEKKVQEKLDELEALKLQAIEDMQVSVQSLIQIREENPYVCTICYDHDQSHSLVPCGHVFCKSCVDKFDHNKGCPVCRKKFTKTQRVFVGSGSD